MIDTHIHVVPPRLPGVGNLGPQLLLPPDQLAAALCREMREAGINAALALGCINNLPDDPLGVNGTLAIAAHVPGLHAIGVMDPTFHDPDHLRRVEQVLATGRVKALKGYLGYLHFPPDHKGYQPYYELAARHRIPVVFHTGDTYSAYAKVKYAHPLLVDEVAVDHPKTSFVLAQVGNPWMQDAVEVVYKNLNVYADLAGLARRHQGEPGARVPLRRAAQPLPLRVRLAADSDRAVSGIHRGRDPGDVSCPGVRGERPDAVPDLM
jgi:predicted TIM-barrel fold metal-dependent hydrolase